MQIVIAEFFLQIAPKPAPEARWHSLAPHRTKGSRMPPNCNFLEKSIFKFAANESQTEVKYAEKGRKRVQFVRFFLFIWLIFKQILCDFRGRDINRKMFVIFQ